MLKKHFLFLVTSFLFCFQTVAQTAFKSLCFVITSDGEEYVGNIVSEDENRIMLKLRNQELKEIPRGEVRLVEAVNEDNFFKGKYVAPDPFAHRYLFGSSAIGPGKNKFYTNSFYGFTTGMEYGITENYSVALNTSIIGFPILLNAQANYKLSDRFYLGGTITGGWGSWVDQEIFLGYGGIRLTRGSRGNNYTFGGGYVSLPFPNVFNNPSNLNLGEFGYLNAFSVRRFTRKISTITEVWLLKNFVLGRSGYQLNFGPRFLRKERAAWTIAFSATAFQELRGAKWNFFPFVYVKWMRKLFTPSPDAPKK